jgi:hypothetical protein
MTRRWLLEIALAWVALTAVGSCAIHSCSRTAELDEPPEDMRAWAIASLHAARLGQPIADPPAAAASYESSRTFVHVWSEGIALARHDAEGPLPDAIRGASAAFAENAEVTASRGWTAPIGSPGAVRYTISFAGDEGPIWHDVPFIENLSVVPFHEGVRVEAGDDEAWITPVELHAGGYLERGVPTPLPELQFGMNVEGIAGKLARDLGHDHPDDAVRFRAITMAEQHYPNRVEVTEENLRQAAIDGARFLLRHQKANGQFTYIYDARTNTERMSEAYNLPRHAGSAYFLAQMGNLGEMPEARAGAIRALHWVKQTTRRCGAPDRWCVTTNDRAEIGSSALAALAAAEVLAGGDDPSVRELLVGLTSFMRSLRRPDGEMMHEFDLQRGEPVDVQYLYYSGETAFALLRAHAVVQDERDLEVGRGIMGHLTGAGWDFLGSRYYYGEEHWTCIAAGEAADRVDVAVALDFCQRWAGFNREVQYGEGETPWESEGAYGVGPLLIPRLTPVASRTEAFISTYHMTKVAGLEDAALRAQIEAALGMLLRWRWAPGPTHLFADPEAAHGGIPGSPAELIVRNDYIQHACSAMIRWAEVLRREREAATSR